MAKVVAVMANWNGGELAARSAASILAQDVQPVLWVVDNGSVDGSEEMIIAAAPPERLRVIRNRCNFGYARANNQALALIAGADYLLLVNNDVILPDSTGLSRVIESLANTPGTLGACGRYEYPDGKFQPFYNRLPSPFDLMFHFGILKNFWFFLTGRQMGHYYAIDLDYSRKQFLEQPAFSCVLLSAAGVERVGHFDENFPIFFNDVDYCWRWRSAGLKWSYFPDWRVIHYKSKTTASIGPQLAAELAGSVVRFARKHYRPFEASLVRLAVAAQCGYQKFLRGKFQGKVAGVLRGDVPFSAQNLAPLDSQGA